MFQRGRDGDAAGQAAERDPKTVTKDQLILAGVHENEVKRMHTHARTERWTH